MFNSKFAIKLSNLCATDSIATIQKVLDNQNVRAVCAGFKDGEPLLKLVRITGPSLPSKRAIRMQHKLTKVYA